MPEPLTDDRQLVIGLTEAILNQLAPDELDILPEVSDEFFDNPERTLKAAKEESLGFGIELALLAPFALSVAMEVVKFLLSMAKDAVGPDVKTVVSGWLRRVFPGLKAGQPSPTVPLSREQLQLVRDVAYARARDLGVEEPQAVALADAVIGGIALADGQAVLK